MLSCEQQVIDEILFRVTSEGVGQFQLILSEDQQVVTSGITMEIYNWFLVAFCIVRQVLNQQAYTMPVFEFTVLVKEIVVIDTLGYVPVKDSLFEGNEYTTMMNVPLEGVDAKFELDAGTVIKNETEIPVFEARIAKEVILEDQDEHLVNQEEQVVSVDAVNGPFISVGSMEEVNTSGNWPKRYGDAE